MLDPSELMKALGHEPEPEQTFEEKYRFDASLDIPIQLTDPAMWENYTNDELYFLDKKIREFLRTTKWKRSQGGFKTTASAIFTWIFHRQPDAADGYMFGTIHMLMKYYCTSYTGKTTYKGKPVSRVYRFSKYACLKRRAYSLRLRLEEADDPNDPNIWRNSPGYRKDKQVHRRRSDPGDGAQEDE